MAIVEHIRWPMYEKYGLIGSITLEDIKTFGRDLLKEMRIQALIQGNVTEESAHNIMNAILTNFNCSRIEDVSKHFLLIDSILKYKFFLVGGN